MSRRSGVFAFAVVLAAACTGSSQTQTQTQTEKEKERETETPPDVVAPSPAEMQPRTSTSTNVTAPVRLAKKPGTFANVDPDDDYVVGPPEALDDCTGELSKLGVKAQPASLAVHTLKKPKITCGAPQVVTYVRGPAKIGYNAYPLLTCEMALALATWELMVQEEAKARLGTTVARIEQLGTYSCREIAAYPGTVSEHAYANAIDIVRFTLASGKTIDVYRDFSTSEDEPKKPAAAFLRAISRRANDEDIFSNVLTPFFDAHHNNHFHLDLGRYRLDGTRPRALE
jgi:hypothetical protein